MSAAAAARRVYSTINADGSVPKAQLNQVKWEQWRPEVVQDAKDLARQLTSLRDSVEYTVKATEADPHAGRVGFTGQQLGAAGAQFTIEHGLGHAVSGYTVSRWRDAAGGWQIVEVSQTDPRNTGTPTHITFASYAAGTADVELW